MFESNRLTFFVIIIETALFHRHRQDSEFINCQLTIRIIDHISNRRNMGINKIDSKMSVKLNKVPQSIIEIYNLLLLSNRSLILMSELLWPMPMSICL